MTGFNDDELDSSHRIRIDISKSTEIPQILHIKSEVWNQSIEIEITHDEGSIDGTGFWIGFIFE